MLDSIKEFILNLFGGIPKESYDQMVYEKDIEYNKLLTKYTTLKDSEDTVENDTTESSDSSKLEYVAINFTDNGEYSFNVKITCPECILVKKGTKVTLTGYKGEELVEKLKITTEPDELEECLHIQEEYEAVQEQKGV